MAVHVLPALPGTRAVLYDGRPTPLFVAVHAWAVDVQRDRGTVARPMILDGDELVEANVDELLALLDPGQRPPRSVYLGAARRCSGHGRARQLG